MVYSGSFSGFAGGRFHIAQDLALASDDRDAPTFDLGPLLDRERGEMTGLSGEPIERLESRYSTSAKLLILQ